MRVFYASSPSWSQAIWIVVLLVLSSCDIKDPFQPNQPLPSLPCAASFKNGFTDKTSYFPGEAMTVFINAREKVSACRLDIYDMNGNVVFSIASPLFPQTSPDTTFEGYDFKPTRNFNIPEELTSGVYLIERQIPLIVKTHNAVDLTVVYPVNTVNAYCTSGGKSLYSPVNRPASVSYHRPMYLQDNCEQCLKWFPGQTDLSIGYISDQDLDLYSSIEKSAIIVILGHSEYWTKEARQTFDKFVDQGGHALIFSGNTMWWQVRYSTDYSKLICYKDATLDPEADPLLKTINWDHPSLQYSILGSIGADFPHGGYGLLADVGWDGYKIVTPGSPLLKGTGLQKGDTLHLPSGEYDGCPIASFDADGYPTLDESQVAVHKIELIGFDRGSRGGTETIGTFIVMQKTASSGIIVNGASYDWCSYRGMGGESAESVKKITRNAIDLLMNNQSVFSK